MQTQGDVVLSKVNTCFCFIDLHVGRLYVQSRPYHPADWPFGHSTNYDLRAVQNKLMASPSAQIPRPNALSWPA